MGSINENGFGRRYQVLEEIGHGGIGRVYRVHDSVREADLALKELRGRHAADASEFIMGFKNEFRIMSEFRHPSLVQVFDFGISDEGIPFITMEFVSGVNLSEMRDLPAERVVDILKELCHVLELIHSRLYVHRDLKPDNIKIRDDGSLRLLDFGLMSQLGVPASGKLSGTYYYIAPEVISGGIIDESTDLYSLGVIGYELLTGHRPFTGKRSDILSGHLKKTPQAPSSYRQDITPSLSRIIMKLLEKDKEKRYPNCARLMEDLQYLQGGPEDGFEIGERELGYLYSHKLIGRNREVEIFTDAFEDIRKGKGAGIFIGGPGGMGKTRLLTEIKILSEIEGFRTVYLSPQTAGEDVYGWIRGLCLHLDPLCGEEAGAVPAIEAAARPEMITEIFMNRIRKAAEGGPLAVFIDDMQKTDLKSLLVFNGLLRQAEWIPLLIAGGFRNDEVEKTSPVWHTVDEEVTRYLELGPLEPGQVRTLIENLLRPLTVSDAFARFCFRNSGGNVFDLMELLRYLVTEGHLFKSGPDWFEPADLDRISLPAGPEDRLLMRIRRLDRRSFDLAGAAAVLDNILELESWLNVSGMEESLMFRTLDDLVRHQVIIRTDAGYRFCHDRIRAALYDMLEPEQRLLYHRKTGDFLEKRIQKGRSEWIPSAAVHYSKSGNPEKAIDYSVQAARISETALAEWDAFDHYRNAARFLEGYPEYPDQEALLLEIHEKAAQFSSAAWIDAPTCLKWLEQAIDHYEAKGEMDQVFGLSLSYVVSACITGSYQAAREKIPEIMKDCRIETGTLSWAVLHGAGVCLADWYQGWQKDCLRHAEQSIQIFEDSLATLPDDAWPAYSWALFWRDKAKAYLGWPVEIDNIEKIGKLADAGKSDKTIYWHSLTAVTAWAAYSGRWKELLKWKERASALSREMGKIYWFECWISHSYLYGAILHGAFSRLDRHIERVAASPDPYQARLARLFQGILALERKDYVKAQQELAAFLEMEKEDPDNSCLEGYVHLARVHLKIGDVAAALALIDEGERMSKIGDCENPFFRLRFLELRALAALEEKACEDASMILIEAIRLAEMLDNPVHLGFIRKIQGRTAFMTGDPILAEQRFSEAGALFLSVGNRFQAGRAEQAAAALSEGKTLSPSPPVISDPSTVVDDCQKTIIDLDRPDPVPGSGDSEIGKAGAEETGGEDEETRIEAETSSKTIIEL